MKFILAKKIYLKKLTKGLVNKMKISANAKNWLKAAGVRAVKTVAQTAVATIGTSAVLSAVDWRVVVSASLLAGILSLLTSVAGLPEVKEE